MSYTSVEAALLSFVQSYAGGATFTSANSSRGDFRALDAEGTDVAAVVVMGKPSDYSDRGADGRGSQGKRQRRHTLGLWLFQKRSAADGGDGVPYAALLSLTDGVIAYLEQYPRLNDAAGVKRAQVTKVDPPMVTQNSFHIYQRVEVTVDAEIDLNWQEAAR